MVFASVNVTLHCHNVDCTELYIFFIMVRTISMIVIFGPTKKSMKLNNINMFMNRLVHITLTLGLPLWSSGY